MDNLKDKRGYRIHLLHQIVNLQNKEQGFSQFYCATLTKHFSVDSYDLKYMSFKFSNDIFIAFEMARSILHYDILENYISLLFCPSVSSKKGVRFFSNFCGLLRITEL